MPRNIQDVIVNWIWLLQDRLLIFWKHRARIKKNTIILSDLNIIYWNIATLIF